jgi:hypothetical protein
MSYRELVEDRYSKYEGTDDAVIWVSCGLWGTRDLTRLEGMRKHAASIRGVAWFVTFGELREKKGAAVLVNYDGDNTTIDELFADVEAGETNPDELSQEEHE